MEPYNILQNDQFSTYFLNWAITFTVHFTLKTQRNKTPISWVQSLDSHKVAKNHAKHKHRVLNEIMKGFFQGNFEWTASVSSNKGER